MTILEKKNVKEESEELMVKKKDDKFIVCDSEGEEYGEFDSKDEAEDYIEEIENEVNEAIKNINEEDMDDEEDEDEDDIEEGRTSHPMTSAEAQMAKKISALRAHIHYYEKAKKTGTRYNKTSTDVNSLKKELAAFVNQFKQMRAKSHPKRKSIMSSYEPEKLTVEDFNINEDLNAIFGEDNVLTEDFKSKLKNVYEASVVTKANEVIADAVKTLHETYEQDKENFASELNEQYNDKVDELVESIDSYLNKSVEDFYEKNSVAIENSIRSNISESFMTKLKDLFESHYIDIPDHKVDMVDELSEEVETLKEQLEIEIEKNISLKQDIEKNKRKEIFDDISEGLTLIQKEKFKHLSESVQYKDINNFKVQLEDIKDSYFSSKRILVENKDDFEIDIPEEKTKKVNGMDSVLNALNKSRTIIK